MYSPNEMRDNPQQKRERNGTKIKHDTMARYDWIAQQPRARTLTCSNSTSTETPYTKTTSHLMGGLEGVQEVHLQCP